MAAAMAAALATSLCSSSPLSLYSPLSRANVFFSSLHDHLPCSRCHSIRWGGIVEEVETVSQKRFSGKGKDEKTFFPADGSRGEAGVSNSAAFASARIRRKDGGLVIDLKDQQVNDMGDLQDSTFLNAVVKVYCTHTPPNYALPWQKQRQYTSTGSAFMIGNGKLLTNVHCVEHDTQDGRKSYIPVAFQWNSFKLLQQAQFAAISGLISCALLGVQPANAVDTLRTCACLLKECRVELAKCISNPSCAANIACLQTCNDRPDETECQIKCGDLFENSVVDEFNECAVSRQKCVPRKSDVGEFPVPSPSVLVKNFSISDFSGKWYITRGLNPTFDVFDCQLHEFHVESGKLIGNLSWRIRTPDGGFFTRSTVQRFVQDPSQPGVLYNHDNEYLHYQDDWYVLSSKVENKPDDYIFIYYRGRNDAWDGYGGAVVYTRSPTLPETVIPELENAAKSIGRDFTMFIITDNTCGPETPLVERLERTVEEGEKTIIREVEQIEGVVEKVGGAELTLIEKLAEGFGEMKRVAQNFIRGLGREEMELLNDLKMEAAVLENVFGKSLPLRKLR